MMRIILCGAAGAMGKTVARVAASFENITVAAGIDKAPAELSFPLYTSTDSAPAGFDVLIDFSHPSLLEGILEYAVKTSTPAVIATTGINDMQLELIRKASEKVPVFFSFNMSFGVNLLAELAKKAAALLYDNYDIEIIEKHHNQKLDAPSGTALLLANEISSVLPAQPQYIYDRHSRRQKREKTEIGISSVRGGTIVGEHEVLFAGNDELITLSHTAMSKDIFAVGALKAALFISQKEPHLYSMKDMIE